jgi:hypothetical protein
MCIECDGVLCAGTYDEVERCSCIILPYWKNHELLLMRSSSPVLKSTWIPNLPLELSSCSSPARLLLLLPCCSCRFSSVQLSFADRLLLTSTSAFLISSITLSSCSTGWLFLCSLLCCTSSSYQWVDQLDPHAFYPFLVALVATLCRLQLCSLLTEFLLSFSF